MSKENIGYFVNTKNQTIVEGDNSLSLLKRPKGSFFKDKGLAEKYLSDYNEKKTNLTDLFVKDLRELLTKYNASIGFSVSSCSDTHGLHDEKIIVDFDDSKVGLIESKLADGWSVTKSDLS